MLYFMMIYADDLVPRAESPNALNELLQALSRLCLDNGMLITHDKTLIIYFRSQKETFADFHFHVAINR